MMYYKSLRHFFITAISVLIYSCASNTQYGTIVCGNSNIDDPYYIYYTNIELLSFLTWNQTESIEPPTIIGGIDSLISRIIYPEIAKRAGIQGVVLSEFKVTTEGIATDIKIIQGIGEVCDLEIIHQIKVARFNPAIKNGKKINQLMRFAVKFSIIKKKS
jgi:TonB family protein